MKNLDFAADKVLARDFLANFADAHGEPKYRNILQDVANRKYRAVQIELNDLFNYKDLDEEFLQRVTENAQRYIGIFAEAVDELMPEPTEVFPADDDHDILMTQRADDSADGGTDNADPEDATGDQAILMVEGVTSQDNLSWDERNGNSNGTQDALQQKECIPGYMDERLEVDNEHQKIDSASDTSSLGLTLVKTKSLLDIVELKLLNLNDAPPNETTQSYKLEKEESRNNTCITQRTPEKLKATNFPATLLRIGQWERISQNEGDILGKCYFAKRRLVWEVLDGALKNKIEVPWSEISAIRATFADGLPSILDVELQKPPELFREMEPQPRKHAIWTSSQDFTNGQAPTYRRHHLEFREGIFEKHYEQLLHYDKRLFVLSQRPFPSSSSPYFNTVHTTHGFPFDPDIHRAKYLPMYNLMSKDLFPYQFPCVGHPRAITARNTGAFEPLRSSMGVVSRTPFLNPMVGAMGVNAPFSVFNFSPSKQTCATLPTDTRTYLSATNFLPSYDNSALNQLPYESTPIWNQRAQQQWSFFNVPSPQTGELPLNAGHATLVPNFLPQQGLASNLSSSTAAAETDHSYSSLIQEIKEHLLGDAPTDFCSDEENLLAEVNSIECLISTTAQPTSEPESSNMVQDRQCIDGEEDESKVLDDSKQSESDDDTEVLVMNLPRVSSDPLLI